VALDGLTCIGIIWDLSVGAEVTGLGRLGKDPVGNVAVGGDTLGDTLEGGEAIGFEVGGVPSSSAEFIAIPEFSQIFSRNLDCLSPGSTPGRAP
jgi:hypothetical protein